MKFNSCEQNTFFFDKRLCPFIRFLLRLRMKSKTVSYFTFRTYLEKLKELRKAEYKVKIDKF